MKYLSNAVTKATESSIERCLILLRNFIEEFDDRAKRRATVATVANAGPKQVKLVIRADKGKYLW